VSYLAGWLPRDYRASALVARRDVVIDAAALPSGITIAWSGTADARVLAVEGDLTLVNVAVTGGRSGAANIASGSHRGAVMALRRVAPLC
jgi:hypothetical protein